ncbi:MAG: hypothetical protein R6T83_08720 [Salinibacter sp.]
MGEYPLWGPIQTSSFFSGSSSSIRRAGEEKLGDFADHIQTVRGVGYRFVREEESAEA